MRWPQASLGEVSELVYGKALRGYTDERDEEHAARVFGTNGPIGWAKSSLTVQPTVIVGRKGAYRGIHFSDIPSWTIDTAFYTKVDPERLDMKWFYYRLLLVDINGMNSGAAIPSTRREDFYSLRLPLPDLSSQRRIVSILSAYDDLIEANRRRIALLEEAARLLYREWFVHFRFPGHEHVPHTDGLPEGWERRTLGDLLTLKRGYDLPHQKRVQGDVPIVSSSGVTGFHNEKKADGPGIVTGRYGTIGEVYIIDEDYWPLNTALYVSDMKGNPPLFLFHALRQTLVNIQSEKAAVPGLNRNTLHTIRAEIPPFTQRRYFEEAVEPLFAQRRTLTKHNQKLAQARDLLLPRLMNGEIAV